MARAACRRTSEPPTTACASSTSPRTAASCSPPIATTWNRSRSTSGRKCCASSRRPSTGRKLKLLGYYRHALPGNWKLYHENLKDPYHATLLHTFLVTFGLLVAGNRSLMLADATAATAPWPRPSRTSKRLASDTKKEMRAYREGMTLREPRFLDFVRGVRQPWSVTMQTIWPNLIVQREMNTLGVRQIVPNGPHS